MKLLAIETAFEACSVALAIDGECRERFELVPRGHAERLLPWVESLLRPKARVRGALRPVLKGQKVASFHPKKPALQVNSRPGKGALELGMTVEK